MTPIWIKAFRYFFVIGSEMFAFSAILRMDGQQLASSLHESAKDKKTNLALP
jgi:hypothetical protein